MEAFSFIKYWRGGGSFNHDSPSNPRATDSSCSFSSSTTTIVTAVTPSSSDSDEGNDDGPFFDLEFTVPDDDDDSDSDDRTKNPVDDIDVEVAPKVIVVQESEAVDNISENEKDSDNENEGAAAAEIKFTISSSSTGDPGDAALSPPPANDLLFPVDSSSMILNATSETIPKFPVSSILKSATKFRVQMLKFNKSNKSGSRQKDKPSKSEPHETKSVQKKEQQPKEEVREEPKPNNKLLTVKLKVEEVMPLISLLFTRDQNGSANSKAPTNSKANKRKTEAVENISSSPSPSPSNEDEKKFSKDMMNKYLKKVKPLYVRVSKRYGDKLKFSGQLSFPKSTVPDDSDKQPAPEVKPSEETAGAEGMAEAAGGANIVLKNQKQGNLQAGLRVVCKHLGKSRSASASAPAPTPAPAPAPTAAPESSRRRDDSLLQQQDGIQSAILHCKRSFNASRGETEASSLSRSVSDSSSSSHENR